MAAGGAVEQHGRVKVLHDFIPRVEGVDVDTVQNFSSIHVRYFRTTCSS